jgi:hypothetical protein
MRIAKLVVVAALLLGSVKPAHAEFGIGFFIFEPTGLDIKADVSRKGALDFLIGWYSRYTDRYRFNDGGYFHITYLYQPWVAIGDAVDVPLRVGIGIAFYDEGDRFFDNDNVNVAARFPFEVGIRFVGTPVEIYFEIALKLTFIDPNHNHDVADLDGGVGVRFMF